MFRNSRFGRYLNRKCFDEETGYLLNYVTLIISDPELEMQVKKHRGKQFERMIWPVTFILVASFLSTVYKLYFTKSDHPIWMVTASLDLLVLAYFWLVIKIDKAYYCSFGAVAYFLCHSMAVVCVYKGWLPESWQSYSKYLLPNSILISFIAVN